MDARTTSPLLQIDALGKRFGGAVVVADLSLALNDGEIFGLVGPNGAGKTTVFNLISGFVRPSSGRVLFRGTEITGLEPEEIARRGLVRSFQLNKLFGEESVEGNIRIACHRMERGGWRRFLVGTPAAERASLDARVQALLSRAGLDAVRHRRAETLCYGDQKRLGIALALAPGPSLLMLDEPFAGMNHTEASQCSDFIREIAGEGTTIFIVDHNMRAIMGICDRLAVLNFGAKIAEGTPQVIQRNPEVIRCYLGSKTHADS
jgi:branched-chain amino acid transport system ATP-binding protein